MIVKFRSILFFASLGYLALVIYGMKNSFRDYLLSYRFDVRDI